MGITVRVLPVSRVMRTLNRFQGFLRRLDVGIVVTRPAAFAHPDFKPKKVELPLGRDEGRDEGRTLVY